MLLCRLVFLNKLIYPLACPKLSIHFRGAAGGKESSPRFVQKRPENLLCETQCFVIIPPFQNDTNIQLGGFSKQNSKERQ